MQMLMKTSIYYTQNTTSAIQKALVRIFQVDFLLPTVDATLKNTDTSHYDSRETRPNSPSERTLFNISTISFTYTRVRSAIQLLFAQLSPLQLSNAPLVHFNLHSSNLEKSRI